MITPQATQPASVPSMKGTGSMSTYGDREMGEGMSYPGCRFAGKYHLEENDCNCAHPNTGDVFFCATHHIPGHPPCPLDQEGM